MSTPNSTPQFEKRKRQIAPILIALLVFLAACGVSIDFFVQQLRSDSAESPTGSQVAGSQVAGESASRGLASTVVESEDSTGGSGARGVTETPADPSDGGPRDSQSLGRGDSTLPFSVPWPDMPEPRKRRPVGRDPSADSMYETIETVEPKARAVPEISIEPPPEDLKISLAPSAWKGGSQLLPSPMFVSQLSEKRAPEIRGGGWVAIDVANSRVVDVELFKAASNTKKNRDARRVIEAKDPRTALVINPSATGFPIVRGIHGLRPGGFEVFENPPCLVRAMMGTETEICEITLRGRKYRYKFEPPVTKEGEIAPDFIFMTVSLDMGRGKWMKIVEFNESFHPIGDPNRDGIPDFYVESITGLDESGHHTLLLSGEKNDVVEYKAFQAPFKGHR